MKKFFYQWAVLFAGFSFSLCAAAASSHLPNIEILATGGTIAGKGASATETNYTSGQVGVQSLIDAVPGIDKIANIKGEQVANIGSQDMNNQVWLKLAKRINVLLARKDVDGIVITHGTDTMEETAYFLNLTVKSNKPVVIVGSMRPSTAMSADGPLNLYNAVVVAGDKASAGRGVLVAMNDGVYDARDVTKTNTTSVATFQSPNYGPLGFIHDGKIDYQRSPERKHTLATVFDVSKISQLPKVGIVYDYSNASALPTKAFIGAKYAGIINAGVGNGNMNQEVMNALDKARQKGILVVRSSRTPTGSTTLNAEVNDTQHQFVASNTLNPQKARILLMLALTKTHDYKQIQTMFETY